MASVANRAKQSAGPRDQLKITVVELVVFALIWLMTFRLIAIPLFILAFWCSWPGRSRVARYASKSILVLSLLAPFDVRIAELSSAHHGMSQARVSVVPYANGVPPAHTSLIAKYGEYYSGACAFPPRWVISISLKPQSPDQ